MFNVRNIQERVTGNPITSWAGVAVLGIGAVLLALGKITWEQFVFFLIASGLGFFSTDPKKGPPR